MEYPIENPVLSFVTSYLSSLNLQYTLTGDQNTEMSSLDLGLRNTILKLDQKPSQKVIHKIDDCTVYQIVDYYSCNYSFFRLPEKSLYLFAGPYLLNEIKEPDICRLMDFLDIPKELFPQLRDYYNTLPVFPAKNIVSQLLLELCRTFYGSGNPVLCHIDLKNLESQDEYLNRHEFQIPEDPVLSMHLLEKRYAREDELLYAVAQGNTAKALSLAETMGQIRFSPRGGDELRDYKNLMFSFNTLMRRTAYTSGVHPLYIDAVSSNYARMIEQGQSYNEISDIVPYMVKSYCHLVEKRSLASYSEPVRQILVTIDASLDADLSLKRFAGELYLNTSYLSALFKKEVGMTLTDYVNKRRIAYAKKLLKSTLLSIQEIASRSGISDLHYFTRLFRRETGMSPREWRSQE